MMQAERLKQAGVGAINLSTVVPRTADRTMTWPQAQSRLTAAGATAFPGGFEGDDLGPMTVTAAFSAPAAPTPKAPAPAAASSSPGGKTPGTGDPTGCPSAAASTPTGGTSMSAGASTPPVANAAATDPTDCSTSGDSGTDPNNDGSNSNGDPSTSGAGDKLAKTGGPVAPLMLAGVC